MAKVPEILTEERSDDATKLVRRYFGLDDESTRHEGASFEKIGGQLDDPSTTNEITPGDLIALATLSVEVRGSCAIKILGPDIQPQASMLLAQIPTSLSLVDPAASAIADEASEASQLWRLLRTVKHFGPTRTSKLLARKRPHLIPIYDSIICGELGLKDSRGHWALMRELITQDDQDLYKRAQRIHERAGADPIVTPLRIIDIVLWRHGKDQGRKVVDDA